MVAKSTSSAGSFNVGDTVVYASHGVGKITGVETQTVAGFEMKMYVIYFEKDKMVLRVPVGRAEKADLRRLSSSNELNKAIEVFRGKSKISKNIMWSKRAQEYENKINSGDIVLIAEVLRDLHRNVEDPNRSYSERMIYESALERFTREYAAAVGLKPSEATDKVQALLKEAIFGEDLEDDEESKEAA